MVYSIWKRDRAAKAIRRDWVNGNSEDCSTCAVAKIRQAQFSAKHK
jgi:hypothetical protein